MIDMQAKYNNQMIAGTMMAQALRLYKSNLTEEGFRAMVKSLQIVVTPFNLLMHQQSIRRRYDNT